MNFKVAVSLLIVLIIGLFAYAIVLSNKISVANSNLKKANDTLIEQKAALVKKNKEIEDYKNELLGKVDTEEAYWDVAKQSNTVEAYLDYKIKFGADSLLLAEKAQKAINQVLTKTGYVQIQDGKTKEFYFKNYSDSELSTKHMIAISDRNIRNGVIGADKNKYPKATKNTGSSGDRARQGDILKVVGDFIPSGDSQWAEIKYSNN